MARPECRSQISSFVSKPFSIQTIGKDVPQGLKSLRENFPIVPSLRDSICVKSFPALPCRATDCPVPSGLIASDDLQFFSTPLMWVRENRLQNESRGDG